MALLSDAFAQQKSKIYLSGYTYSTKQKTIGEVKVSGNSKINNITIGGADAASFKISKNNILSVSKVNSDVQSLEITLTAKTSAGSQTAGFKIVNDQFIHNKVIAHRGAWKNTGASENSVSALQHAIDMGCEGAEFDVHMSADSALFIHHDDAIQGKDIEKTDAQTLAALKLANGENLPTLADYMQAGMKQNKTKLILEIKPSAISKERAIALTHKVMDAVRTLKAEAWVDYISFDYEVCLEIMKLAPYAKVAYLKGDKTPAELAAAHFYGLDYHYSALQKNPAWIKEARDNKLTINVWTVNDEAVMDWLIKENADFITTNEPELLLKKLKK
ncbi:putative glycerophosphodiester phosphodiesterase [Pedobacter sp. BAL39]|nr:putative glycerophosphodiester phosphodiesterase [Pedobacter sp. BAL39]